MALCFLLDQLIGPYATMNTYPDVEFRSVNFEYCVHLFGRLLNGYWSPESQTRTYLKLSAKEKNVSNPYTGILSVVDNVCHASFSLPFLPNNSEIKRDLITICSVFGVELFCGVLALRF